MRSEGNGTRSSRRWTAARFETVSEMTKAVGANGYIEIALKKLRDGEREAYFYLISRGFYERNGEKRWTKFVTVPASAEFAQWMGAAFAELAAH